VLWWWWWWLWLFGEGGRGKGHNEARLFRHGQRRVYTPSIAAAGPGLNSAMNMGCACRVMVTHRTWASHAITPTRAPLQMRTDLLALLHLVGAVQPLPRPHLYVAQPYGSIHMVALQHLTTHEAPDKARPASSAARPSSRIAGAVPPRLRGKGWRVAYLGH
jgi:hypothetical protein